MTIGGQRVNGSFSRCTRPPSWSTLTQSGSSCCSVARRERDLGHLLGRFDVAREQDEPAEVELARERAQLDRDRQAVEAADEQLADVLPQIAERHAA